MPIVFVVSVAAMAYVIAGYPLVLNALAKRCARPTDRAPQQPALSIIVPVHNGERFLERKLESIANLDVPADRIQLIIASDGSTDRTEAIARAYADRHRGARIEVLPLPRGGKPAALNAAIERATGEILVLTDVRQVLAPESVRLLIESFADASVGVASGELVIRDGSTQGEADIGLYWRIESRIRQQLSAIDSMFGATGPFYAIRRSLAVAIPEHLLLDDMYLPLTAFFRGYRLVVDERARAFDYPTTLATEYRRKVRTLGGNYQILLALPQLLGPGNRMWFHFISYKVGRLLLPWFLLAAFAASTRLPRRWRTGILTIECAAVLIALIDPAIPKSVPLKRLSSPARTFFVMMIAAVHGLSVFFVPARSLWKVTSISITTEPPGSDT